jgi:hypothetical protein
MKTSMKKLLYLPIVIGVLLFASCQEEQIDITQGSSEEILVAKSEVATLMKQTATNDGSKDNIIDRASCFKVSLPVTVVVNGVEIIVNTEDDYDLIEDNFDESEDDNDSLDIIFPITIVLEDYTEVTIQSTSELEEYISRCKGDDEEDDDIECIDFKYPILYSVFDKDKNLIKTVRINNDREMFRFINRINESEIIRIKFPITLVLFDGTSTIVNSLSELKETLKRAVNFCDEDDDNDYGDDDFTLERLNKLLVMCPWIVNNIHRDNKDLTDNYREYLMLFKEDGTVKVRARNGDIITGSWTTRLTDHGAMIKLEFTSFVDFALEWFVYDINRGRIKLFTSEGNHIILEKHCDLVFDHSVERIKNILQECLWRITRLRINDFDKEREYIGTPLKFNEDGTVKLRINGELVNGTWDILEADAGFVLQMTFDNRPDLNLHWLITLLEYNKLKLENQNSEMVIKRFCQDHDQVRNLNAVLNNGNWEVASYIVGDSNETENYAGFVIDFLESGAVLAEGNGHLIDGSWLTFRHNEVLRLALNFGLEPPFDELNNRWRVVAFNNNKVELYKFSDDDEIMQKLILEKL